MITTTVKKAEKENKRNYPYIGFNNGLLVYFTEKSTGLMISEDAQYKMGTYMIDWNEESFEIFEGEITLKNS